MNLKFNLLGVFLLVIVSLTRLWAQSESNCDTLNVESQKNSYSVDCLHILTEPTENRSIANLKNLSALTDFTILTNFDSVAPKKWYYGKIIVKSELNVAINLALYLSNADLQEIYIPSDSILLQTGGYRSKKNNDEIILRSNIVSVPIKANAITEIYFAFKGHNQFKLAPVLYDINFIYNTRKKAESKMLAFNNFFLGSFLIILVSSILIVLFSRKRVHLYYALYVLFVGIINSSFDVFLNIFSMSGRYMFFTGELLGGFGWISYFLFIQLFLETKRNFPFWHKILNIGNLAATLLIVYIIVTLLILHDNILYHQYRNLYALVVFVLILSIFIRFVISKKQIAVFIGSGGLITLLGWILYLSLQFWGYKDLNIVRTGQLFEVLIFATAIAFQVAKVYKENERVHKEIIVHLETNKVLQEKVNHELEEKVRERTIELMERNEELSMQSEEILCQNEQLENAYNEISNQKEQIELSHKLMTNSILYAKRIQNAVLSRAFTQTHNYAGYFVYFAPKNIVSGDFYYMRQKDNKLYIVVADCTGHGVPGAFMSILGITLLDEIIKGTTAKTTAEILDELREQIKLSLKQTGNFGEQQDGMDLSLCCINSDNLELTFSGAYNPCLIYRNNNTLNSTNHPEIFSLEANRMPIGIYIQEKPFSLKSFQLQKDDILYLFSDGYFSQFGGPKDEKLKTRRFKDLLAAIYNLPLETQKNTLESYITEWKGPKNQTDDILVFGFKV